MPEIEHEKLRVSGVSFEDGMAFSNEHHTGVCIIKDGERVEFCVKKEPIAEITKIPIVGGFKRLLATIRMHLPVFLLLYDIRKGKHYAEKEEDMSDGLLSGLIGLVLVVQIIILIILPHIGLHTVFWLLGYQVSTQVFHLYCGLLCTGIILYNIVSMRFKHQENARYHGAEHMCAQAYEAGLDLTPEVVSRFSPYHPRCGTTLVTLICILIPSLFYLVPIGGFLGLLLKIVIFFVGVGVATDIFRILNLYAPFLLFIGTWMQRFSVLWPERKHIDLAIRTANILRD
jgi:uncharacterized protein YqhQ